jgi:hypothetical protein
VFKFQFLCHTKTVRLNEEDQLVSAVFGYILLAVYFWDFTESVSINFCLKNADVFNVTADGLLY